jgi:HK97 family phage major capsid protein
MKPKPNQFLTVRSEPDLSQTFRREFELDRALADVEARTIPLSFSSEMPVERYFGIEVLGHDPSAVRLDRLNNGAPLLLNHDIDDQIGVVESATIDPKTRRGRAVVRFSKSEDAEEIFQDVLDGIRRLVSVGYLIHKTVTESKSGGVETVRVTDWEPYEISLVSVPADNSVGVGRGASNPTPTNSNTPSNTMNDTTHANAETPAAPVVATRATEVPAINPNVAAESQRIADINVIATRAQGVGLDINASELIANGSPTTAAQERLNSALIARQTSYVAPAPPANQGPSKSEQRDLSSFSIIRGLRSLANGEQLSGVEKEMHQEAQREAKATGLSINGQFSLPQIWLNHGRRDLTATGGSNGDQGGVMIATQLSGSFIELLHSKMVLRQLGAQFLTGLVGNLDIPKMATGATPVKKAENAAADEASHTFTKVSLTPNRLPTYTEVSKQLLNQSSFAVDAMVKSDLATALALGIEAGAIYGGGTTEGLGILSTPSIGDVAGGANGAAPTWAHIVALETAVSVTNADMGSLSYLTNAKVRGKLKSTAKVASSDSVMVWDTSANPLNGYGCAVTNQVPSTLTKNSSGAVCSAIIFGNFADLLIGQWGGIDITVDPYTLATTGQVRITAETYYDTAVRRAASFAAMLDALTA